MRPKSSPSTCQDCGVILKHSKTRCVTCYHRARITTLQEHFWLRVRVADSDACWLWTGTINSSGYGRIQSTIHGRRMAHRTSWELHNGPIPDGLQVLHRCDTPACVRPDHLWLGTNADNVADRVGKGRTASGDKSASRLYPHLRKWKPDNRNRLFPQPRPHGEQHGMAKLTTDAVRDIRQRHAHGETRLALAAEYGVSYATICDIVTRRHWKHLE